MKLSDLFRKVIIKLAKEKYILLTDNLYIRINFKYRIGKKLNLNNPKTFNEKLQWLKLYDRDPEYTKMVDKYAVKQYVANIIGEEYIIPTLGIWEKFDDINFGKLPNQFVLKCTHDSGGLVICKDKEKLDLKDAKKKINKCLKRNYYYCGREWPYKNVKPRIIAEKYMENKNGSSIYDYKFYCFDGKSEFVMICKERETGNPKFYYFDRNWNFLKDMSKDGENVNSDFYLEKPSNLELMFNIAEKLSQNIKFVRIDLYNINEKIYFGEFTFFPSGGFDNTRTKECDEMLNNKLFLKFRR